ncbi:MAG TPA: ATP-dependent DNA helicase UvrD2 [Aeromicrobium sp.]|nr:ATP-dependent DNA helicase UvrD2 [Aeromicrobium sp.]HKY57023.1 ATP-dependent DNA helicase UvrD2 [Aeromicrobium sp.]
MSEPEDLLANLDPEQRAVATTLRGPLCVIAGAGTGKTRAITHRIAYGVATGIYRPSEVLAVTFTTRAAGEMRSRLGALGAAGVQARTFHSASLRQARYFWPQVYGTEFPEIVQSKFALVADAARRVGIRADQSLLRDLSAEIEWAKVSNIRPADYEQAAHRHHREVADLDSGTVAGLMVAYEDVKRERGRIDMEDILLITAAILADDERAAAQVRQQYRWFVVDEFQDVNPLQAMLLDLWLGGRDEICVVGDPRQTIYTFAGASPAALTGFTRKYPDAERVELVRNYRSTPQIVSVANAVFPRGSEGVQLSAQSPAGEAPQFSAHTDDAAEARAIAAEAARQHQRGVPWSQMAVLFRINAQAEPLQEAFGEAEIPYTLRGVEGFFQRAEVRQAVALLRAAARAAAVDAGPLVQEVRGVLSSMGYADAPPHGAGAVRDRWESMQALVSMAASMPEAASMDDFVNELAQRAEHAHAPVSDGIVLATLHAAKGLEWDVVFCAGVREGRLPFSMAETPAEIEEERRLFYVGVTRARRQLNISWRGRASRFLDPLLPADQRAPRRSKVKKQVATAVESLDAADRALFEQLKVWRLEEANRASVPAFVVFTDATLAALAQNRPSDQSGLLRMPGIGVSKIERYGDAVLKVISGA